MEKEEVAIVDEVEVKEKLDINSFALQINKRLNSIDALFSNLEKRDFGA